MAKVTWASVDAYLAAQPDAVRPLLRRVRTVIQKTLPDAEECINYQIPAYKADGANVLFFAGWKEHFSLYPASAFVVENLKAELAGYELSRGTIRFPFGERLPVHLIARIAKLRWQEMAALAEAKAAKKKKPVQKTAKKTAKKKTTKKTAKKKTTKKKKPRARA